MSRWLLAMVAVVAPAIAGADTLRSKSGQIQITLPKGWEEAPADSPMRKAMLVPDTKVFARNTTDIGFAMAFHESKEDLNAQTLAEYAALILKLEARKFPKHVAGDPVKLQVAGKEALRYEIRGERDGLELIFLKTFTHTAKYWIQVTCWTTPSHKAALAADCAAIAESFQDVAPAR